MQSIAILYVNIYLMSMLFFSKVYMILDFLLINRLSEEFFLFDEHRKFKKKI